jgi:hypothetical protein
MNRPGSAIKRKGAAKPQAQLNMPHKVNQITNQQEEKLPEPSKFLLNRDYVGAITILECEKK